MLTLVECRKLIDPKNVKYTDEELELKLGFLTSLAQIIIPHVNHEDKNRHGPRETRSADGARFE
jgi:hypothetical protein